MVLVKFKQEHYLRELFQGCNYLPQGVKTSRSTTTPLCLISLCRPTAQAQVPSLGVGGIQRMWDLRTCHPYACIHPWSQCSPGSRHVSSPPSSASLAAFLQSPGRLPRPCCHWNRQSAALRASLLFTFGCHSFDWQRRCPPWSPCETSPSSAVTWDNGDGPVLLTTQEESYEWGGRHNSAHNTW